MIEATKLHKVFGSFHAVRDISLTIAAGEVRGAARPKWRRQDHHSPYARRDPQADAAAPPASPAMMWSSRLARCATSSGC